MRCRTSAFLGLLMVATAFTEVMGAQAAPRWQEIGKTSTGNTVYVDPRSISRDSTGIITATVRVVYSAPVETPQGPITGSRAVAMFDCVARKVAVKESIIWHDESRGTVYRRSAPTRPGFSTVFTSNFSAVALEHLCASR